MLFQTPEFAIFFLVVSAFYFAYPLKLRHLLLLFASYFFYMSWDYRFGALILVSTGIDYAACLAIENNSGRESQRRFYLVVSLVTNLTILAVFKYFNFFANSFVDFASLCGFVLSPVAVNIILPVGISFFTFQSMSHTIDVYRGEIKAERSFVRFALYVAFFPQLVAGPIVRAVDFLPQLNRKPKLNWVRIHWGFERFLIGLLKKVVIADNMSPVVDLIYGSPTSFSTPMLWFATICYAVQIYADFSGYSDMAIGCARILGFKIPENFNMPYLASSPSDFWRRWHISLSTWLRDYLYIPLGGNRYGTFKLYRNLMITMVLGGLWHGASYNFIIWGVGHGLLLCGQRVLASIFPKSKGKGNFVVKAVSIVLMFVAVITLWVPFRAATLSEAMQVLNGMYFEMDFQFKDIEWVNVDISLIQSLLVFVLIAHLIGYNFPRFIKAMHGYMLVRAIVIAALIFSIWQFHYRGISPFVYFQF
ncbi:MAG: MBOAT family protein [bacterium]|nr:MBOAT family protein [bacterium]